MGPAVVGTLHHHRAPPVMAVPLGVLGAIYLNEYGKQKSPGPADPVHDRRDDRRAVDRDGPVHLHGLGAAVRPVRLRRRARPRLPDAADRHPLDRGDAAARARRAARGERRARAAASGARSSRSCCPPPCPASSAAPCWPWPAPPARPRRCCSPSAPSPPANSTSFSGPNTALSSQIFTNAKQRRSRLAHQIGLGRGAHAHLPWCSSSPCSPRLVSARFASKRAEAMSPCRSPVPATWAPEPPRRIPRDRHRQRHPWPTCRPPVRRRHLRARHGRGPRPRPRPCDGEPGPPPVPNRSARWSSRSRAVGVLRRFLAVRDVDLEIRQPRDHRLHRPVGLRQDARCCAASTA